MENIPSYHTDLITKYLSGEITGDEMLILSGWIEVSIANRKLFEELRKTWILAEQEKMDSKLDVEWEWDKFREKINESTKYKVQSTKFEVRSMKFEVRSILRIAAVIMLLAVPSFFLYRYATQTNKEIIAATDKAVETILPDGTAITLNRSSRIEYSGKLKGSRREVKLSGEAFFSVKHNEKSRFIISSGNLRIEDIGTSFYVNTNKPDGRMEVILEEGKAAVYFQDNPAGQTILSPGERVDIDQAAATILKSVNQDVNYLAWKTNKIVFAGNTLPEVISVLNKVYHSDLRLSGNNINNCRLSATFDNQTLEAVLHVIRSTLDVSIISKGNYIEISGNPCD